ncbi:MAG: hypothetical protein CYPHOPRED_005609 [Cyphobasidiales sp. Tagirdzhanova-0007]|nr:MAG: hypothetical protein CYPHOPRED_005609 [Cyphobasidiales sp. Tagirdzhanova-0007]
MSNDSARSAPDEVKRKNPYSLNQSDTSSERTKSVRVILKTGFTRAIAPSIEELEMSKEPSQQSPAGTSGSIKTDDPVCGKRCDYTNDDIVPTDYTWLSCSEVLSQVKTEQAEEPKRLVSRTECSPPTTSSRPLSRLRARSPAQIAPVLKAGIGNRSTQCGPASTLQRPAHPSNVALPASLLVAHRDRPEHIHHRLSLEAYSQVAVTADSLPDQELERMEVDLGYFSHLYG